MAPGACAWCSRLPGSVGKASVLTSRAGQVRERARDGGPRKAVISKTSLWRMSWLTSLCIFTAAWSSDVLTAHHGFGHSHPRGPFGRQLLLQHTVGLSAGYIPRRLTRSEYKVISQHITAGIMAVWVCMTPRPPTPVFSVFPKVTGETWHLEQF